MEESTKPARKRTGNIYADFPGLREAEDEVAREVTRLRELACSDVNFSLCGVEVSQLKLRHWQTLSIEGNPFVCGGTLGPEHVLQFLWVLSVGWSVDPAAAEAFALAYEMEADELAEMAADIQEFIDDALVDMQTGNSRNLPPAGMTASILHEMESAYPRFTRAEVLNMNLGEIFQRLRLINDDSYRAAGQRPPPQISRVDKIRGDIVFGRITL